MLIRPEYQNLTLQSFYNKKIITRDTSKVRFDIINYFRNKNDYFLERSTYFGRIYNVKNIFIKDFIKSKLNVNTKELEVVETISGMDEIDNKEIYNDIKIDNYDYIYRFGELKKKKKIDDIIYYLNDKYNINYNEILGLLSILITSVSVNPPIRMDIIIDTNIGINIKNIKKILNNDSNLNSVYNDSIKSFIKSLNLVYNKIKTFCVENNIYIRIYSFIREFDKYIKLIINDKIFDFHYNNSDHIRLLYSLNVENDMYDYLNDLIEMKCFSTVSMFSDSCLELKNTNKIKFLYN